eukprot:6658674-Lingulodinium_polyedra.AAC.1
MPRSGRVYRRGKLHRRPVARPSNKRRAEPHSCQWPGFMGTRGAPSRAFVRRARAGDRAIIHRN